MIQMLTLVLNNRFFIDFILTQAYTTLQLFPYLKIFLPFINIHTTMPFLLCHFFLTKPISKILSRGIKSCNYICLSILEIGKSTTARTYTYTAKAERKLQDNISKNPIIGSKELRVKDSPV